MVFVCPLIDWTSEDTREYRAEHAIPESPAAALLHRSGECNCGSYAGDGERAMLRALYPEWWRTTIAPLEEQAQAAGIRWCRWGGYDIHGNRAGERSPERTGLLCESCEARERHAGAVRRRGGKDLPSRRGGAPRSQDLEIAARVWSDRRRCATPAEHVEHQRRSTNTRRQAQGSGGASGAASGSGA
jgi:3'-phosphoadenosine 5'-phosphosulfate sulfotransferase (PAPS reductase)/FAD synthetase